jgi:RNA-directed DNA polymerase
MTGERTEIRTNIRPAKQLWLPLQSKGELSVAEAEPSSPDRGRQLMESVLERENLRAALRNVMRNGGSPGIDGMTVKDLPEYLKKEWPKLRRQLLNGEYVPTPVRRVEIPKPGGGIRQLGIPTVLDRFRDRLGDVAQFISLYRQEGNPREQPLQNKGEYTEH